MAGTGWSYDACNLGLHCIMMAGIQQSYFGITSVQSLLTNPILAWYEH